MEWVSAYESIGIWKEDNNLKSASSNMSDEGCELMWNKF